MKLFQKLNIYLTPKVYSYSSTADDIIKFFIKYGEVTGFDNYSLSIAVKSEIGSVSEYSLWVANYPYSDLSTCTRIKTNKLAVNDTDKYKRYILYDKVVPARKTQIHFYDWLELQYPKIYTRMMDCRKYGSSINDKLCDELLLQNMPK